MARWGYYHRLRGIDIIFYLLRTGCHWRLLRHEFPPWPSVYYYFRRWEQEMTEPTSGQDLFKGRQFDQEIIVCQPYFLGGVGRLGGGFGDASTCLGL